MSTMPLAPFGSDAGRAGISPMVWRRLLVPAETSIAGLHAILQAAFGRSDEHLHRFTIHAVEYGLWRPSAASSTTAPPSPRPPAP